MQQITPSYKEVDYTEFVKRPANEKDFSTLIDKDSVVVGKDGNPVLLYFKFPEDTTEVVEACKAIPYQTSSRTGGLKTTSRIFGFDPATGIRKPYCSTTSLSWENPKEHEIITNFSKRINEIYKERLPDAHARHEQIVSEKIKDAWRIPGTPFTSGIINKNNQLNYHFDSGNFQGVYSNMVVFKSNVAGGYLALPEYDIGLQCADNTLVMFDGQSILHGVTPIKYYSPSAYRYSIVYYSLSQMWKCDDVTEEVAKIRNRRKKLEETNKSR